MDNKLFQLVSQSSPKFTDEVAEGLAVTEMRKVEAYVSEIFRCAAVDFPSGLTYDGFRRCTPHEEYLTTVDKLTNNASYELAPSDTFMVKYKFSYNGEPLRERPLNLPFVGDGGIIRIRGSVFAISPVLADKAISVGEDTIFVPLTRAKLIFNRQLQFFMRSGTRETVHVVHSKIHNRNIVRGQGRAAVQGKATMAHYLFAKYGLSRTFAEYTNSEVHVGNENVINETTFPPETWYICSSTQRKPIGVRDRNYVGTTLRLAIRKADYNTATSALIGGFFYVVDLFPQRVEADYVDEVRLWQVLLGHLIFGGNGSEGKLESDVILHLKSLDGYIDELSRYHLQSDGIYAEDLYGLFMHIIETFSQRVTQAAQHSATMYDKRLMVLRYVMQDVVKAINTCMYKLNSNTKRALTPADINKVMDRWLKPNLALRINRNHGEVSSVASPGDNKHFKVTSQIVAQADSSGGQGLKTALTDRSNLLHASIAEVGSFLTPSKSGPTGRSRINPYVHVAPDGLIVRDPEKQPLLDRVQRRIQR